MIKNDLNNYVSADGKTISLPVAIGTILYYAWSDCSNCCWVDKEKTKLIRERYGKKTIECSAFASCHTVYNGNIHETLVTLDSIKYVIERYGKTLFHTEEEAREATRRRVEENQIKMRELGFNIDNCGKCIKD